MNFDASNLCLTYWPLPPQGSPPGAPPAGWKTHTATFYGEIDTSIVSGAGAPLQGTGFQLAVAYEKQMLMALAYSFGSMQRSPEAARAQGMTWDDSAIRSGVYGIVLRYTAPPSSTMYLGALALWVPPAAVPASGFMANVPVEQEWFGATETPTWTHHTTTTLGPGDEGIFPPLPPLLRRLVRG